LTRAEFEDALRKGLGRSIQYLQAHDSTPFRDLILRACLEDWRYDRQTQSSRGLYLYEAIQATGDPDYYRDRLVEHLLGCSEEELREENVALAYEFAVRGDQRVRAAMYRSYDRIAAEGNFDWGYELIQLDGLSGLLHVIAPYLAARTDDDPWPAISWIMDLEERDGEEEADSALERAAEFNPAVAEALAARSAHRDQIEQRKASHISGPLPPWPEMRESIIANRSHTGVSAVGWARRADEASLREAAEDIVREQDPQSLLRLLLVFLHCTFPLEPHPLLRLVTVGDELLAWRAAVVLSNVEHPDVRSLALQLVEDPDRIAHAARLLESNWREGDGSILEKMLEMTVDADTIHSIGFSVKDIAKKCDTAELELPLLLLYEEGPCSLCREDVVKWLLRRDALPNELRMECRHDSSLYIRRMIEHGPDVE
jgi:hypothetical protein